MSGEHFLRCRTCGRYLRADRVVADRYCSEQCSHQYACCPNCGRYFRSDAGYGRLYCSRACSVQYKMERSGEFRHSLTEEPV